MRPTPILYLLTGILVCSAPDTSRKTDPLAETAGEKIAANDSQTGNKTTTATNSPTNWNDLAQLLSGHEGVTTTSPAILRHRAYMKDFWARVKKENLEPIAAWRAQTLPSSARGRNVLYPLSGADFLNAYAFYPDAKEYVLIALEPPGTAPQLDKMTEVQKEAGLESVRSAIGTLARNNYLQSRLMAHGFGNPYIGGTLPAFLIMLAGLGHTVKNVEDVGIVGGRIVSPPGNGRTKGIRISYVDSKDKEDKTLIYLQMRLEQATAEKTSAEGQYLRSLGPRNMLLKSAVYILHWDSMKLVHDVLMEQGNLIIQDDSGLPYKSFQNGKWKERVFGNYVRALPVGGIPDPPQQPDLAERFKKSPEPLPFAYGYGILRGKNQSNLMMFERK
ncbi:MAG: hypothetical protein K8S54_12785 [Spirochaetia bacterium]|nr:hypothetical protein [Spirochaetia bacterium]